MISLPSTARPFGRARVAMLLAAATLGGCVHASVHRGSIAAAGADPAVLDRADRAFAADVAREGLPAWMRWFEPDGGQISPGKIVRTDADRSAHMAGLFGDSTLRLVWEPDTAVIAASGELGYTIGHSQVRRLAPDGTFTVLSTGRYLTVWRKQPDGSWKVELDQGTNDPKPNAP